VASQPRGREIHVILDNLATHKAQAVRTFLVAHSNVRLHFTPTYASWLNQVELWFATIERDLLARGIFTSVSDLGRKISAVHRSLQQIGEADPLEPTKSSASN
jgi:transposase